MRTFLILTATLLAAAAALAPAQASIQGDLVCVEPDIEFPVPCEDDD